MLMSKKYIFFVGILIAGVLITVSAPSWLFAWVGMEVSTLCFIPMMWFKSNTESVVKYFLVQAVASQLFFCICLVGCQLFTPALSLTLMLKLGVAPLHFWFPSIAQGLNWNLNYVLAVPLKVGPLFVLSSLAGWELIASGLACGVIGGFGGLNQPQLRKMMAFSTLSHMAWVLVGVTFSVKAWVLYFLSYAMMASLTFHLFNVLRAYSLVQLMGGWRSAFFPALSLSLLSMGGVPPLLGFVPKWFMLQELLMAGAPGLALTLMLLSLFSLYFYLRVLWGVTGASSSFSKQPKLRNILLLNAAGCFVPVLLFS